MENAANFIWIIVVVIALAGGIKLITLANGNRGENEARNREPQSNTGQAAAPAPGAPGRSGNRTETGPMVYFADNPHNLRDKEYQFNYKLVNGSWRAYILRMPSLGGRDASGYKTHRLFENGQPYVCWDRPVGSLREMQTVSRVWANSIQEYIATGRTFG